MTGKNQFFGPGRRNVQLRREHWAQIAKECGNPAISVDISSGLSLNPNPVLSFSVSEEEREVIRATGRRLGVYFVEEEPVVVGPDEIQGLENP